MPSEHWCGGQKRTLGVPAREAVIFVGKLVLSDAQPANPEKCPACGTVCKENPTIVAEAVTP